MTSIIGITGYAGSGKDTVAEMLVEEIKAAGHTAAIFSFAGPIREIANALGLAAYDRDRKEVWVTLLFDDFEERLILEIDCALGHVASMEERCELFSFFVEALADRGHLHYGPAGNTLHISPRVFMQLLGTEAGRRVSTNFWVDLAGRLQQASEVEFSVTSDVRFPNEADSVDVLLGRVGDVPPVAPHASEQHIVDLLAIADVLIPRTATLEELKDNVAGLLTTLGI